MKLYKGLRNIVKSIRKSKSKKSRNRNIGRLYAYKHSVPSNSKAYKEADSIIKNIERKK